LDFAPACVHALLLFRPKLSGCGGVFVMAIFFCKVCNKETRFVPIHLTRKITGVSRSTVYYWMDHRWIHWLELPSGRRVICQESLSHSARGSASGTRKNVSQSALGK
jgi:hypothetical protein